MAGESDKGDVYRDKRGEHRWRRKASNGRIIGACIAMGDDHQASPAMHGGS